MKMRNSGEVPGARGERTCQEAAGVVGEVCDDRVNDLLRKLSGRNRVDGLPRKFDGRDRVDDLLKKLSGTGRACGRGL